MSVDGTAPREFLTSNGDIIAGFSSRGPTPFTYLLKPDVTAPGVNVLSSVFNQEYAFFQGTSMATPHVSGAVALLRQLHPDWSPAQIKSALTNTAKRPVLSNIDGTSSTGVLIRGGGRIDLNAASSTPLTIEPASASFGRWMGNRDVSASLNLKVMNVDSSVQSCSISRTGPTIVNISTNGIYLSTGENMTFTLTLNAGRGDQTASGDYDGDVVITCGEKTLKVPWWVRIER
jgi:minor extracellular serine protease Vpr